MSSLSVGQGTTVSSVVANHTVLHYTNDHVVARIMTKTGLDRPAAEQLFQDSLMFLSLSNGPVKLAPSAKIDLAWHEFILHTRDYADFCQTHFGRFIHHEPMSWSAHDEDAKLDVMETAAFARSIFGELSPNWDNGTFGATCGSGGC